MRTSAQTERNREKVRGNPRESQRENSEREKRIYGEGEGGTLGLAEKENGRAGSRERV